ncbi:MAG: type II toxin-antitoxin system RelE/ParE family toxin [Chloroflexota bacterium]|nr:type II toxin-antitoxin system RelE/ParE family toxin [Chloroflexota bacterium]
MTFDLRTSSKANAYLRRLDADTQRRIKERLRQIGDDPYGDHSKPLVNAGGRRASRVGDYRIIFAINEEERVVGVSAIGPRGRVYRDL